ncbi:MAG: AmmeMemoRadiSam system protein B [Planctomycetia bacterium]|nr:AmmeMemoRadiSam system protein B [Planctomycetia bacterium]
MPSTEQPFLSEESQNLIFKTARDQVIATVQRTKGPNFSEALGDIAKLSVLGAFFSLKKQGELRSCMGYMSEGIALGEALRSAAISAAKDDPRFPPIRQAEFPDLNAEVWILWGKEKATVSPEERPDIIEIGKHGVQIQDVFHRGLLLPGVATEFGMNSTQFLEAVCQKAGLPKNAWKSDQTTLFLFEGLPIARPFLWELNSSIQTQRTDVRAPAVAGMFYPANKIDQKEMLDKMFDFSRESNAESVPTIIPNATAVMVPHAGWIYSGHIAAEVLSKVNLPETVVILAPKHHAEGKPWAVAPQRYWDFFAGQLENDLDFVRRLTESVPNFVEDATAHRQEHSIEVLLPLIARCSPKTKVVGVLVSGGSNDEYQKAADQWAKMLSEMQNPPLLIVSSDMNHFANEEQTQKLDKIALDALESLDPLLFYRTVLEQRISMCGVQPMFLTLEILKRMGKLGSALKVRQTTSAEISGDRSRVVGYAGYIFLSSDQYSFTNYSWKGSFGQYSFKMKQ